MTKPRSQQISLDDTPFYHCVSRCVRRAFLCGFDQLTNRSYEHRRQQIQDDMLRLSSVFYIDIAAFAIMPNHHHTVLCVRREDALADHPEAIVTRALQVVAGNEVAHRFLNNEPLQKWEHEQLNTFVDTWRKRLYDISWFMKFLNERIARRANKEDDCKGHFWESRYKLQALLDDKAVLSAMAYVDLNPIRAGIAATPEDSEYTSIQQRIDHWKEKANLSGTNSSDAEDFQPNHLMRFIGNYSQTHEHGLNYNVLDYLELIDWTGRAIRDDKRGYISASAPPILERIDICPEHWIEICTNFENRFKGLVGSLESVKAVYRQFGLKRSSHLQSAKILFS